MKLLPIHPIAEIFPRIDADARAALAESIRVEKQQVDILTYEGQVLDGRERQSICAEFGIAPRYREWDGKGTIPGVIAALNLHRRHLTASQLAMVAARLLPLFTAEDEEPDEDAPVSADTGSKQAGAVAPPGQRARDQAAAATGASPASTARAAKVLKNATPAVAAAVDAGRLPVAAAARLADLPPAEQARRLNEMEGQARQTRVRDSRRERLTAAERLVEKLVKLVAGLGGEADDVLEALAVVRQRLADLMDAG